MENPMYKAYSTERLMELAAKTAGTPLQAAIVRELKGRA
jgi:hypothetical protein